TPALSPKGRGRRSEVFLLLFVHKKKSLASLAADGLFCLELFDFGGAVAEFGEDFGGVRAEAGGHAGDGGGGFGEAGGGAGLADAAFGGVVEFGEHADRLEVGLF